MMVRFTVVLALYIVVTYFMCGVPYGKIVARCGADIDIQKVGSGNIGTTNVARTLGVGPAALTLALDAGKAFLCCVLVRFVFAHVVFLEDASLMDFDAPFDWIIGVIFLAALCGHIFSPYMRFRGGKGIAVGFGATLGICWQVAIGLLVVWIVMLALTRIVSAASCIAAAALPCLCWLLLDPSPPFIITIVIAALLVIWAHRSNLHRLLRGQEAPFSFHRSNDSKEA